MAYCTKYLRMYWTDLYQIFSFGEHMDKYNKSGNCFAVAQGTLLWF